VNHKRTAITTAFDQGLSGEIMHI